MAVYDKSGNVLSQVYDRSGNALSQAYNADGDVVFTGTPPEWDYTDYTISTLFRYAISSSQSFAVYGGKIAQVKEDDSLHIVEIATGTKLRQVAMDMGHGNSCQFSNEFYAVGDEFPLFYIRNDGVWVYRITDTTSTLIRKYSFPTTEVYTYVVGFGVDSANRKFYTASYTEGTYISKTGQMCICEYDMDDVTDNGDGTYSMALLRRNTFAWFDNYQAVQGCCFKHGYLFITTGYTGNTNQDVVMVDVSTLTIAYAINLGAGAETEGCAWVGDAYMIVGQRVNTYTYKKIEFAEVT